MKKLIFSILISFLFFSCGTTKQTEYHIKDHEIGITIDTVKEMAIISSRYRGKNWAFIYGLELKNTDGDFRDYKFKDVHRSVNDNATVYEYSIIILQDFPTLDGKIPTYTKFCDFVKGGVKGRIRAKEAYYDLEDINIIYK